MILIINSCSAFVNFVVFFQGVASLRFSAIGTLIPILGMGNSPMYHFRMTLFCSPVRSSASHSDGFLSHYMRGRSLLPSPSHGIFVLHVSVTSFLRSLLLTWYFPPFRFGGARVSLVINGFSFACFWTFLVFAPLLCIYYLVNLLCFFKKFLNSVSILEAMGIIC